jgi:hypothetical protein
MFHASDPLSRYREGRGKQVDVKTQLGASRGGDAF